MRYEHLPAERLGGAHPGQKTGKALPERASAIFTAILRCLQQQNGVTQSPAFVPGLAHPFVFEAQPLAPAMRADGRTQIACRNSRHPCRLLNACNLVPRQTDYRPRLINVSSQERFYQVRGGGLPPLTIYSLRFLDSSKPVQIDSTLRPINSDSRATAAARTLAGMDFW